MNPNRPNRVINYIIYAILFLSLYLLMDYRQTVRLRALRRDLNPSEQTTEEIFQLDQYINQLEGEIEDNG